MGKISIIPKNHKKGIINQALLRLRANKGILNSFLKYYLESSTVQSRYFIDQNGAAIQNVGSIAFLKTIPFPKISIELQEKLVEEIAIEKDLILGNKKLIDDICSRCNSSLAGFYYDIDILSKAMVHLEKLT